MWVHPGNTPQERRNYLDPYLEGFDRLLASGVALGGYVDRPRSTGIISLLHLARLVRPFPAIPNSINPLPPGLRRRILEDLL